MLYQDGHPLVPKSDAGRSAVENADIRHAATLGSGFEAAGVSVTSEGYGARDADAHGSAAPAPGRGPLEVPGAAGCPDGSATAQGGATASEGSAVTAVGAGVTPAGYDAANAAAADGVPTAAGGALETAGAGVTSKSYDVASAAAHLHAATLGSFEPTGVNGESRAEAQRAPIAGQWLSECDPETVSYAVALFSGTNRPIPTKEHTALTWAEMAAIVAPEFPPVCPDKDSALYFVSGALQDAPLVGKTLKKAQDRGQPLVGRQRSNSHMASCGPAIVLDIDAVAVFELEGAIRELGCRAVMYTSYSFGMKREDGTEKRGGRIILAGDRPWTVDEHPAVMAAANGLLSNHADEGAMSVSQAMGAYVRRSSDAFCRRLPIDGGALSIDKLVARGRTLVPLRKVRRKAAGSGAARCSYDARAIKLALEGIPNDETTGYMKWVLTAGGVYSVLGPDGVELFEEWSARNLKKNNETISTKDKYLNDAAGISFDADGLIWSARRRAEDIVHTLHPAPPVALPAREPRPPGLRDRLEAVGHAANERLASGLPKKRTPETLDPTKLDEQFGSRAKAVTWAIAFMKAGWPEQAYRTFIAGCRVPPDLVEAGEARAAEFGDNNDAGTCAGSPWGNGAGTAGATWSYGPVHPTWADEVKDKPGIPKPTYLNTKIAIPALGITCRHDTFHGRKLILGQEIAQLAGEITDDAAAAVRDLIVHKFGFDPGKEHTFDALRALCIKNRFNPVQDWLANLKWDGQARLDTWPITYAGAADTPLNRAIAVLLLIAMVRRAIVPGCKYDIMVVLEGEQGCGKSSLLQVLAGDRESFTDAPLLHQDARGVAEVVGGKWVLEIPELAGLRRSDVEDIKALITRTDDRARPAYGRYEERTSRTCVFVGTTNDDQYLADDTGNRRFVPIRISRVDLEALERDRDQLFAEAVQVERTYGPLTLPPGLWVDAATAAEDRRIIDPWADTLAQELDPARTAASSQPHRPSWELAPTGERRITTKKVHEVLGLFAAKDCNPANSRRIAKVMRSMGWAPDRWRPAGSQVKVRGFIERAVGGSP